MSERFENSFYRILNFEHTEEGYRAEVELSADHPIYKGHFPNQPVVPGVCTMRVVRELTARAVGCAIWFDTIREAKFVSALIPCEGLRITVEATLGEQTLRAVVRRDEQVVLKLQASWERE